MEDVAGRLARGDGRGIDTAVEGDIEGLGPEGRRRLWGEGELGAKQGGGGGAETGAGGEKGGVGGGGVGEGA